MEYAKRNDALGNWNFDGQDIFNGTDMMKDKEVIKVAKEVVKCALRTLELKMQNQDITGTGYKYKMGINIDQFADVTLHGERNSRVFFRCGGCDLGSEEEHVLKGLAWAIYQLAMPKILKECKHISEYKVDVGYVPVFGNVGMTMELVLE